MLIDQYMPEFDFSSRYQVISNKRPLELMEAIPKIDLSESVMTSILFKLRGLPQSLMNFGTISDHQTLLSTETRVLCLSERAKKRFRPYWIVIAPFSGIIRKQMLRLIEKQAH